MAKIGLLGLTKLGPAAALASALLWTPVPAHAQDDLTLSMARERFKEGVGFFDQKQFAKARVAFLQAYALKKHPAVLLNLAQSELRSAHEADAAKHFAQYLREHKEATDAERQGAAAGLAAAKALVAEVTVVVDLAEAEVFVDGELEARSPLPGAVYLAPGKHALEARKGDMRASTEVKASAGLSTTATLKLNAPPAAAPSEMAPAPQEESSSAPSSRKGFFSWLGGSPPGLIGVGLTGAGVIGGVAFYLGSESSYDAADSVGAGIAREAVEEDLKSTGPGGVCIDPATWLRTDTSRYPDATARAKKAAQYVDNCDKYQKNIESGDTFKTVAIVSFAVAGAAAVGTIIYYLVDSKETSSAQLERGPRLVVAPVYEPAFAGAVVSGSF